MPSPGCPASPLCEVDSQVTPDAMASVYPRLLSLSAIFIQSNRLIELLKTRKWPADFTYKSADHFFHRRFSTGAWKIEAS